MAALAWQSLPNDGIKGGNGKPYVVTWDGDPEKVMGRTLGRSLSSLDAGVRLNLRVGRRLDLGRPQTLIYEPGMLASLPDGKFYLLPPLYLPQTELGGQQPALFLPSPPFLQSGDRSFFETGRMLARVLNFSPSAHLCPPDPVAISESFRRARYSAGS